MLSLITTLMTSTTLFLLSGMHHAPPSFEPRDTFSSKEIKCLEKNVWHESRGEGLLGMLAVAKTTLNRVKTEGWPPDVCKVVYQHKQFSWTQIPEGKQKIKLKNSVDKQSYSLVQLATQLSIIAEMLQIDFMDGATYYHTTSVNPVWGRKMEVVGVIGDHIFKKDK